MCVLLDTDGRIRKRPVVCGTLYHREMQGLHIPTYTYGDSNPNAASSNPHSNGNAFCDSNSHRYVYSDRDANSFSYGNTDG